MACCLCMKKQSFKGENCSHCNKSKCKYFYNGDCIKCIFATICIPAQTLVDALLTGNKIPRQYDDKVCNKTKKEIKKMNDTT